MRSKVDETFVIVEMSGLFSSLWHYNSCDVTETSPLKNPAYATAEAFRA